MPAVRSLHWLPVISSWHSSCADYVQITYHPTYLPWSHLAALLKATPLFHLHQNMFFLVDVLSLTGAVARPSSLHLEVSASSWWQLFYRWQTVLHSRLKTHVFQSVYGS